MKRFVTKAVTLILLTLALACAASVHAEAASVASKNKKAHQLYTRIINEARNGSSMKYKIIDITGDGVHELLIKTVPQGFASGASFNVYRYTGGTTKLVMSVGAYGIDRVYIYRKTKVLVTFWNARGQEIYRYYKMNSGLYKEKVSKYRTVTNQKWVYQKGEYALSNLKNITKAQFLATVSKLKKGKYVKVVLG